ncbi:MAG: hypothetical protein H7306_19925 [Bacteriovorax sp.]|nr:hypothetical protein [Rhizobacter sp.]
MAVNVLVTKASPRRIMKWPSSKTSCPVPGGIGRHGTDSAPAIVIAMAVTMKPRAGMYTNTWRGSQRRVASPRPSAKVAGSTPFHASALTAWAGLSPATHAPGMVMAMAMGSRLGTASGPPTIGTSRQAPGICASRVARVTLAAMTLQRRATDR